MASSLSRPLTLYTPSIIFDILIENEAVLTRLMFHYKNVTDLPNPAKVAFGPRQSFCFVSSNKHNWSDQTMLREQKGLLMSCQKKL